jgi:hypothetical protein
MKLREIHLQCRFVKMAGSMLLAGSFWLWVIGTAALQTAELVMPTAALALETSLDESIDFYEYTDSQGGIHFVDSLDKIPHRYRDRVIVRKDVPAARQTTRIQVVDKRIYVPVSIMNGGKMVQTLLLLDTGSSITCITEEIAALLNIAPGLSYPAKTRLADGSEIGIRVTSIESVSVGLRSRSPLLICILPQVGKRERQGGYLGLDFLGEFQYQIDIPNQVIRWQ